MSNEGLMFIGSGALSLAIGAWWVRRERAPAGAGGRAAVRELDGGPDAPVWLVAAVLVWLASMVGASLAGVLPAAWAGAAESPRRQAVAGAGAYGLAVGIGVVVLVMLRGWLPEGGRRAGMRAAVGDVPRGAAALLLVAPFYVLVSQVSQMASRWVTEEAPSTIKHETLRTLAEGPRNGWWWMMIAGAAVGAPLVEELVYRVFMQSAAVRATRGAWRGWVAVAMTSAVWAPIHLIGGAVPVSAVPSLFVLGLGIGIAYERTRRLGVPIVMHMLFNTVNLVAVMRGWVG